MIQTGAWLIFYDFNCIEPNVLSVVAQQMATIQNAKAQNAIKIVFQETTLKLDATCGVFVTINPDYQGNIDAEHEHLLWLSLSKSKSSASQQKARILTVSFINCFCLSSQIGINFRII